MKKIVICPACGFVGSTEEYDFADAPCCPDCDTKLRYSGYSKDTWNMLDLQHKKDVIGSITGSAAYSSSPASSATTFYKSSAPEEQMPVESRSRFPIFLLGILIGLLLGYFLLPKVVSSVDMTSLLNQLPPEISQYLT